MVGGSSHQDAVPQGLARDARARRRRPTCRSWSAERRSRASASRPARVRRRRPPGGDRAHSRRDAPSRGRRPARPASSERGGSTATARKPRRAPRPGRPAGARIACDNSTRRALATRSARRLARVANAKRERIERVGVGESLAPKLRQEPPAIAQAPRAPPDHARSMPAPRGRPRARRTQRPGAGEPERRPCSSTSGRGSRVRARADRGLYWAANGA